jgi:hypothetical protein
MVISVVPRRSRQLLDTVTTPDTLSPSTNVPFVDPRSSTSIPSVLGLTAACRPDIFGSSMTRSAFPRPMTSSRSQTKLRPLAEPVKTVSVAISGLPPVLRYAPARGWP